MSVGRQWIGLMLLALVGVGCSADRVKPSEGPSEYARPGLGYRGIRFENRSFSGMDVVFSFELVSNDLRPAKATGCHYRMELEGLDPISGASSVEDMILEGRGKLQVTTTLAMPWPRGAREMVTFLTRKKIPYKFFLDCNLEGPAGPLTASASDAGSVPLPRLPELTISGATAERFTGKEIRLNFELSFVNENPFSFKVDRISYKISARDILLAQGDLPVAESIPPNSEASYDLSTELLSAEESKEIKEFLQRSTIDYRLEGAVYLGEMEVVVDTTGTISFAR